jgi:hypothetical protein
MTCHRARSEDALTLIKSYTRNQNLFRQELEIFNGEAEPPMVGAGLRRRPARPLLAVVTLHVPCA